MSHATQHITASEVQASSLRLVSNNVGTGSRATKDTGLHLDTNAADDDLQSSFKVFLGSEPVQQMLKSSVVKSLEFSLSWGCITRAQFDEKTAAIMTNQVPISDEGAHLVEQAIIEIVLSGLNNQL